MNRQLSWDNGQFDEIELVYDRGESDESIGKMLEKLETQAIEEAKASCVSGGLINAFVNPNLTKEQLSAAYDSNKEGVIQALSQLGLASLVPDLPSGSIRVTFTPLIQLVLASTMFDLLNRLEKLDGALNVLKPNWTLVLEVPLGGRKGLVQWEILIMSLYPWLSIEEVASNETAIQPVSSGEKEPEKPAAQKAPSEETKAKPSFWKRLFGKDK